MAGRSRRFDSRMTHVSIFFWVSAVVLAALVFLARPLARWMVEARSMLWAYAGGLAFLGMLVYSGLAAWNDDLVGFAVFLWCVSPLVVVGLWATVASTRRELLKRRS